MTVKELIKELEKLPPNHRVLVDRYSDYADPLTVKLMVVEPQQGGAYYIKTRATWAPPGSHGVVYIGRDSL
jgi:hypothetical protein